MSPLFVEELEEKFEGLSLKLDETLKLTKDNSPDLDNVLKSIKGQVGDKGDTPTDEELLALIRPLIPKVKDGKTPSTKELLKLIRPLIPEVKDGETPSDQRLTDLIKPLIPQVKDGKDADETKIVDQVFKLIKIPELNVEEVIEKINTLETESKIDVKRIKNLKYPVGGIRFFENLEDVGLAITDKRKDVLIQYDSTLNRWQTGPVLTISDTEPTSPQTNDLWVDLS